MKLTEKKIKKIAPKQKNEICNKEKRNPKQPIKIKINQKAFKKQHSFSLKSNKNCSPKNWRMSALAKARKDL